MQPLIQKRKEKQIDLNLNEGRKTRQTAVLNECRTCVRAQRPFQMSNLEADAYRLLRGPDRAFG